MTVRRYCCWLYVLWLSWPVQVLAASDPAAWLAALERVRDMTDSQAAATELSRLATEVPAELTDNQQHEWLALQASVFRDIGDNERTEAAVAALEALAARSASNEIKVEALLQRAQSFKNAAKPAEALALLRQALVLVEQVQDLGVRYATHNMAAILYSDTSDFENALQQHLKALPLAEQSGDKREQRELQTLNNLGVLYLNLRHPEQALAYLQRAKPLAIKRNSRSMLATIAANTGYALSSLGRHDEAAASYQQALQLARELGDERSESIALVNLSDDALQRQAWTEAADYARAALLIAQKRKDRTNEAIAHANIGLALAGQGLIRQGLQELQLAQEQLQALADIATEELVQAEIARISEQAGLLPLAVTALKRQLQIREQLYSEARQRAVTELQERFDASARQKQIELLARENQLQAAEIDNRRLYLWVIGLIALTVILAAIVAMLSYWRVRDANRRLQAVNEKLADQSIRDPLTGLFNRRSFQLAMERRWTERERRTEPDAGIDAFVLLDIDHFKRINDSFGHAAGDAVLIEVANRLNTGMRDSDMVLRWGGEEFLLYLRSTTGDALRDVVARVLNTLGETPVQFEDKSIPVTASAGFVPLPFSGLPESEFGWERAVQLADLALYLGKGRGRNRAYGVLQVNGDYREIAPQLEHNLAHAIRHQLVTAVEVLGPGAQPADADD
ncbi:MAG: diguanylate cyclase domain-containing protein [Permianibacter sp.]